MRQNPCAIVAIGLVLLGAAALSAAAGTPAVPEAWQRWLAHVPPEGVNWRDARFGDALSWLRDRARTGAPVHMNVVVDRAALESVGLDEDTEVTLELREVPMSRILDLLLADLTPDDRLAFTIDENVLRITTRDRLGTEMTVRTYDVSGSVVPVPDFTGGPVVRMDVAERTASREGSQTGSGPTFESGRDENGPQRGERVEELVEAVRSAVERESWQENGGEGTIAVVGTTLVVRNSAANQEIIAGLLDRLSK